MTNKLFGHRRELIIHIMSMRHHTVHHKGNESTKLMRYQGKRGSRKREKKEKKEEKKRKGRKGDNSEQRFLDFISSMIQFI